MQVKKIEEINRNLEKDDEDVSAMVANAVVKIPQPKPGADMTEYNKQVNKISSRYDGERQRIEREKIEAQKKVLAVLTPAQQSKWLDLAGPIPKS